MKRHIRFYGRYFDSQIIAKWLSLAFLMRKKFHNFLFVFRNSKNPLLDGPDRFLVFHYSCPNIGILYLLCRRSSVRLIVILRASIMDISSGASLQVMPGTCCTSSWRTGFYPRCSAFSLPYSPSALTSWSSIWIIVSFF